MIIQALVKYYDSLLKRGDIEEAGWGKEKVSFALNISNDGELLSIVPLLLEENRAKRLLRYRRLWCYLNVRLRQAV